MNEHRSNEGTRLILTRDLHSVPGYRRIPEGAARVATLSRTYDQCVAALTDYLLPFWERGFRSLKRFIRKVLRPFRRRGDLLRLIAGASVKALFIACLLQGPNAHAITHDPQVMQDLQTLMQVEAANLNHELVVFDPTVAGLPELMKSFNRNVDYLVLDGKTDGIAQIAAALENQKRPISSLHIISHGEPGAIMLGSTVLDSTNLAAHKDALQSIGNNLVGTKDILLYGCRTAAGPDGKQFVEQLHALTGADIAASDNLTGAAALGGDWRLEVVAGSIDTPEPFIETALRNYRHLLNTITVTSNADSGAGTLRQAIADASSGDVITFAGGTAIPLLSKAGGSADADTLLYIDKNLTIDGDLNNDGTADVAVDGQYNGRVFEIAAGASVTLDGLLIKNGKITGVDGAAGTDGTGEAGSVGSTVKGGCIYNAGSLVLAHGGLTLCSLNAGNGGVGGGGAAGAGGGFNGSDGGNGGNGGNGGSAFGGAVYNAGSLFIDQLHFSFSTNSVTAGSGGNGGGGGGGGGAYFGSAGSHGTGHIGGAGGYGGIYAAKPQPNGGNGGLGGYYGNPAGNSGYSGTCMDYCSGSGGHGGTVGAIGNALSADIYNAGTLGNLIVVNTAADNTTAGDGFCTLREAMFNVEDGGENTSGDCAAGTGNDRIVFAGDYTITLASELSIAAGQLTIAGNGAANTVLQASTCDPVTLPGGCTPADYRVLSVGASGDLTLDNVTVRYGQCNGACTSLNETSGGGIASSGNVILLNSRLEDNVATTYGSALYSEGTLNVSKTTFSGNYNSAVDGGGTLANFGTAWINSSTFNTNSVPNGGGGAIYGDLSTTLFVYNSTFANNTAAQGGAVHNRGTATITNNTFAYNDASGVGRAIHNWNGTLSLSNNIMSYNTGTASATCYDEGTLSDSINNLIDDGSCSASITADPLLNALGDYGGSTQTFALHTGSPAIDAGDDGSCTEDDQRGVMRPQGAHCDIGSFETTTYSVTPTTGAHGSIDPATVQQIAYGDTTSFTLTPDTGYGATATGCGGSLSGNTYTTGAIVSDCTVTATFLLAPVLTAPTTMLVGANIATVTLQSDTTGTGYITVLLGSGTACGTGDQVRNGLDSTGAAAYRIGSLPLTADTPADYTVRNLTGSTAFTVCFAASGEVLQPVPATTDFTTTAAIDLTNAKWTAVGIAEFSAGGADYPSLAFAPDGTPFIAYTDGGNSNKATVMQYDGSSWVGVGGPGFSAGSVLFTTLAFAPHGTPYVAYLDTVNGGKATVMQYDGSSWVGVGGPGFSASAVDFLAFAFAPDGTPYVAFRDTANGGKATVMHYSAGSWTTVGSAGFSAGDIFYTSLAFAPDGTPYLAYTDFGNSGKATVMKYDGFSWVGVGSSGFSASSVQYPSLSFAPDGTPYVAYEDPASGNKATVMKYDGSSWVVVGSPGFTAGTSDYGKVAFAPDGTPYLAHLEGNTEVTVLKYTGSAWVTVGTLGTTWNESDSTSFAFGPDGTPYVAFTDTANSTYGATVMKLAPAYLVTYDGNGSDGGSVPTDSNKYLPGDTVTVSANTGTLSRTGYAFTDWNTLSNGTGTSYSASGSDTFTMGAADVTLYAQWALTPNAPGVFGDTPTNDATPTWTWTSGGGGNGTFRYDLDSSGTWTTTTATSYTPASDLGNGDHTLSVQERNNIGNWSASGSFTITINTSLSAPVLTAPTTTLVGANIATVTLQSDATGTGYITILSGSGTACGTGTQIRNGQDSSGAAAYRIGSLPLTANTPANYTVRNLAGNTDYTVCFTAFGEVLQSAPATTDFTTTAAVNLTNGVWTAVGSAGFSAGAVSDSSLVFSPDGTPYVGYEDGSDNWKATMMVYSNGSWTTLGSAGFSAGSSYFPSFSFAPDGTLYAAYIDGGNGNKATVMLYSNGSWTTVGNAGFSAGGVDYTSLAISPDGTPYVAYADYANSAKATVMKYSNGTWTTVGSAGFSAGDAYNTSLAIAPDGTPYVAYQDVGNGSKATVMLYSNGSWTALGSAGFSAGAAYYPSLAYSPDGTPYVAYDDGGNGYKATVMKYSGGTWTTVGSAGFSPNAIYYTSLSFAPDGTPYVAYWEASTYDIVMMKYNGSSWVAVGSALSASSGEGNTPSLAFGPDGTPYVAYLEQSSDKATVMKLAPAYLVTYDGNNSDGGSVPTDSNTYLPGDTVTVSANTGMLSRTGYTFNGWNTASDGGGTSYGATGSDTFTMGTADVTLYAQWTINPVNGTCGTDNGQTLTSTPTNLCTAGTPSTVSGSGPWTWSCAGLYGGSDANCSANLQTWTVTPSAGANGSISPSTPQTVNHNATASFTVTPNSGYHIGTVTGCGGSLVGNTYTTGSVTADCTVTAGFTANTAPTIPTLGGPADRSEVLSTTPTVTVNASTDVDGDPVSYVFEIDSVNTFDSGNKQSSGAIGTTSWTPAPLTDNTAWYWRVRATDGTASSGWMSTTSIFVNTANDAPTIPAISSPADGGAVSSLTPTLTVTNASDVDHDNLTCEFEVYANSNFTGLIASATGIAQGSGGTTSWTVSPALSDNTTYYWLSRARDEHNLAGSDASGSFRVNTANSAPTAPSISSPASGSETTSTTPALAVNNATDVEGDSLHYVFEIDSVNTFNSVNKQTSGLIAEGSGTTTWTPSALSDNTTYYWRAKANDGIADSNWMTASIFVNTANDAPGVPTLLNPADGSNVTVLNPTLAVNAATDPDNDSLTYDFAVYSDSGLTSLVTNTAGAGTSWVVSQNLTDNATYWWTARAVDEHGLPGAWMSGAAFVVKNNGTNNAPTISLATPGATGAVVTGNNFTLAWTDADPDSNAQITLGYDTTGTGCSGTTIAGGISEDDPTNAYTWNITGLATGSYSVYAVIDDGTTSVCSYAPGQLTKLPASLLVTPSAGTGGSLNPATAQPVAYGGTTSFTVTPNSGYAIQTVTGCNGSLVGNTYTTGAVTANCTVTASFTSNPVNGSCGTDNGQTLTATPTNLCATGTPSSVTGSGPWTWTCNGANGGTNATCSASLQTPPGSTPSGDLTGDNAVDIADALKALRIAAGLDAATSADLLAGDVAPLVSGTPAPDGTINSGDVVVILRKAVGLTSW